MTRRNKRGISLTVVVGIFAMGTAKAQDQQNVNSVESTPPQGSMRGLGGPNSGKHSQWGRGVHPGQRAFNFHSHPRVQGDRHQMTSSERQTSEPQDAEVTERPPTEGRMMNPFARQTDKTQQFGGGVLNRPGASKVPFPPGPRGAGNQMPSSEGDPSNQPGIEASPHNLGAFGNRCRDHFGWGRRGRSGPPSPGASNPRCALDYIVNQLSSLNEKVDILLKQK